MGTEPEPIRFKKIILLHMHFFLFSEYCIVFRNQTVFLLGLSCYLMVFNLLYFFLLQICQEDFVFDSSLINLESPGVDMDVCE